VIIHLVLKDVGRIHRQRKVKASREIAEGDAKLHAEGGWRIQHPRNGKRWIRHDSMTNGLKVLIT
jgi:hypothetical protein